MGRRTAGQDREGQSGCLLHQDSAHDGQGCYMLCRGGRLRAIASDRTPQSGECVAPRCELDHCPRCSAELLGPFLEARSA
eukprot:1214952-Pyramimonas_sp.AAC.1